MKKRKHNRYLLFGLFIFLGGVSACASSDEAELVNTQTSSIKSISKIVLDYDADDVVIKDSEDNRLILKEYLSKDKRKYYSTLKKRDQTLSIKEGKRPLGSSFKSKMVLYLPKNYDKQLQIHSTSGKIDMDVTNKSLAALSLDTTSGQINGEKLNAENLTLTTTSGKISGDAFIAQEKVRLKSTSGEIELSSLKATEIDLQTTSAETNLESVNGQVSYETKSGNFAVSTLSGSGSFTASGEGRIEIKIKRLSEDLSAFSKNGNVKISLPKTQSIALALKTKEGKIKNKYDEKSKDGKPQIKVETRNGDITID